MSMCAWCCVVDNNTYRYRGLVQLSAVLLLRTNLRTKVGKDDGLVTLVDFNTLKIGFRVIVADEDGGACQTAIIEDRSEQKGRTGFMVKNTSYQEWVHQDRILDVIMQQNEMGTRISAVNVADEFKRWGEPLDFNRLGDGSHIVVDGEEGPLEAVVVRCCLQGFMVKYEWNEGYDGSSFWVAWNNIANIFHDDFENKLNVAKEMKAKILELLTKSEYEGASKVYNKARDEGSEPQKLWATEVARDVRRHIFDADEVNIYFPNLPPRPLAQEHKCYSF